VSDRDILTVIAAIYGEVPFYCIVLATGCGPSERPRCLLPQRRCSCTGRAFQQR
jgi:hypothetical protein